jgi:predicted nucleic acid-binding protein
VKALVVDASAGLKLVLEEPGSADVKRHVTARLPGVFVPWLFWQEVVNVLSWRRRYSGREVLEAVYELERSELVTVQSDRALLLDTIDAVERHGLSAYDATYLTLAHVLDADLLTADRHLAAAAGRRAIVVGDGHLLAELPVRYGAPDWPNWPGAAAYLQELRVRARGISRS